MKFTVVFIALLSISTSWAIQDKSVKDPKDKREAPVGYGSYGQSYGQSSGGYLSQPQHGHGDASAISIGAGYSIGGAKPAFSFGGPGAGGPLQLSSEHLPSSGHATIQLAPITLQPNHGSISSNDLSQIMSQLSHGVNVGGLSFTPANNIAEFHTAQVGGSHGGQELSLPQYTFESPKFQQYSLGAGSAAPSHGSSPAYAAGTKGLSSYGSTGPVLFSPSDAHGSHSQAAYALPSSGHSFGSSGALSLGSSDHGLAGITLGGAGGHSLGEASGHALGGSSGHSFGGASGYALLGDSGHSFEGTPENSLGGAPRYAFSGAGGHSLSSSLKGLSGSYAIPSKTSFKPSAFLGTAVQGDSNHGLSALSEQYSSPSFGAVSGGSHGALSLGSGDHGTSYAGSFPGFNSGSTYKLAPSFETIKGESAGGPLDAVSGFSSSGHFASPTRNSYGFPANSYTSGVSHAASSSRPHFVSSPKHSAVSFGGSSFRGAASSHGLFSSSPKHSYGGPSNLRYTSPQRDLHGAHSETVYNTIKYSEELKPHVH